MPIFNYIVFVFICICVLGCNRPKPFGDEYVERKELISRNDATNIIPFPLVDSATNIYFYAKVGGLQSLDSFVRLQVAKADVTNQLDLMIKDDSKRFNRVLPYLKTNLTSSEMIMPMKIKLNWWVPEKITNDYYVGQVESYAYQIWVDDDTSTLFVHQND